MKSNRSMALAAGTIAFFGGYAAVALFGTTVNRLSPLLHLTILQVGILVAIPTSTGAFLRIPFSAWVESHGGRKIILIQLVMAAIGMLGLVLTLRLLFSGSGISASTVYYLLLFFGALAGTGISTFSSGITYVSYWFPKSRQGTALGTFAGVGNAAPGIFTAMLPYALIALGLVGAFEAWLAFLIAVIVIFAVIGYDTYYYQFIFQGLSRDEAIRKSAELGEELFPSESATKSLALAAKSWRVWLLVIMYLTSFGGFEALTEWLPTYWTHYIRLSLVMAGLMTGVLYSLITALVRVPGGVISDKWGGENTAIAAFVIMILGSAVIIASKSFLVSLAGEVIMGISMGIANAAVFKLVPRYAPEAVGGASGWVGGLGSAGGLLIPPLLAAFVSIYGAPGYSYGFLIFTALAAVSIAFSIVLKRAR